MRRSYVFSTLILAAAMAVAFAPQRGLAQGDSGLPLPPGGFRPPPMAPIKPYTAVAAMPPAPFNDPSFAAFRKQLAEVAHHKNRGALAKLVVAHGFFWMQDKDLADKRKSGIANLAKAVDLGSRDGAGWDVLANYADEHTAAPLPDHPGVICAPANPKIDSKAFEKLLESTGTQPPEWGYPTKDGIEVRRNAGPNAPVIDKLGMTLVRVLSDTAPPTEANQQAFLHVALPSGKSGFVPAEALAGLGGDQICYTKEASGWKIAGYFGGAGE